jgi:tRNA threonylcarbamoyl adenosine modification protein YeaZ
MSGTAEMANEPWLLAMDTATSTIVVAAGTPGGRLLEASTFEGRHRHSQELLPAVARLVERLGLRLANLTGIVVGTGPGGFTGLRVGLATAKTLAHELGRPIVGIPTSDALLATVQAERPGAAVLWLPSGPNDRVAVVTGSAPVVVRAGEADPIVAPGAAQLAVDLGERATDEARALGQQAIAGLPAALLRLGAARLAAGDRDDPERLVPAYASAPRGAPTLEPEGGVAWSRDPR